MRRRRIGRALPQFRMTDHDEMTGCSAWDDWERREANRRELAAMISSGTLLSSALCVTSGDPPSAAATAVRVGPEWDAHVDRLRREYAELAVRRGHVRRYP